MRYERGGEGGGRLAGVPGKGRRTARNAVGIVLVMLQVGGLLHGVLQRLVLLIRGYPTDIECDTLTRGVVDTRVARRADALGSLKR